MRLPKLFKRAMSDEVCRVCLEQIPERKLIEERVELPPLVEGSAFGGGTYLTAYYCSREHQREAHRRVEG
jgi:hypothetical protein